MKIKLQRAFTLVELLIVIALIAILSVAVLSTINPIEQTNKARDAKFKNDAAELLGAQERYYASSAGLSTLGGYPWNDSVTFDGAAPNPNAIADGTPFMIDANDPRVGIFDVTNVSNGLLISSSELKAAFAGKEPFKLAQTPVTDIMYVQHTGAGSNYVCFCPKARANRTGQVAANLKCSTEAAVNADGYYDVTLSDVGANGCVVPADDDLDQDYCLPGNQNTGGEFVANLMCVPEGNIQ